MTASVDAPAHRVTFTALGREWVRYACTTDSFSTDWHLLRDDELAQNDFGEHIKSMHPELVPYGKCNGCGRITDHFRAVIAGVGVMWGCEQCAPAPEELLHGDE